MTKPDSNPQPVMVVPNGETIPGGGIMTQHAASKFFATRGDNLERAVEDVKNGQLIVDVDGVYLGGWLMTEISFWNRDKERLVLLCENAILVCKYDFVAMKLGYVERIPLNNIKVVQHGKFDLPENSVCVPRMYKGLRITWGSVQEQPWYQRWNPLNFSIPLTTFTSHPVLSVLGPDYKEAYDVQSFLSALKQALGKMSGITYLDDQPIVIESYAGFLSHIHNQSRLGFSRERGGVSF